MTLRDLKVGQSARIKTVGGEGELRQFLKLLPLQGDRLTPVITQGVALGYELLPFQGVWHLLAIILKFSNS